MQPNAFRVTVPATTANVGPGFDAVGIALSLRLRAEIKPARRFAIGFAGGRAPTHDGYERAIRRAIEHGYGRLPAVSVQVHNDIPLGKGLGSSAAAAILGLCIAQRCAGKGLDRNALAAEASVLEGHADNACAAVFGGAVISASLSRIMLAPPRDVSALIVVPDVDVSTHEARALLPQHYSRDDVAFTAARASLLGAALAIGSWRAMREAMQDRIHQPYRQNSVPGLADALALQMRGLIGIALSGAGPSVLAFSAKGAATRVGERIRRCFIRAGVNAEVLNLEFAGRGAAMRDLT